MSVQKFFHFRSHGQNFGPRCLSDNQVNKALIWKANLFVTGRDCSITDVLFSNFFWENCIDVWIQSYSFCDKLAIIFSLYMKNPLP